MSKPRVTIIFGTRPEAIKLAPVVKIFKNCKQIETRIILTGQHKEMVTQVLKFFDIKEDKNFELMKYKQSLSHITCKVLAGLEIEFDEFKPDIVIIQGDTSTAFAAALAAFYKKIKVAHVEAGLRTDVLFNPFPEEANRRLISQISSIHFAPTNNAKQNLINSGVCGNIYLTGNTVIDSLLYTAEKTKYDSKYRFKNKDIKLILCTIHRRENWSKIKEITSGILKILETYKNINLIIPLHKNETVRKPIIEILGKHKRVSLTEPLEYEELIAVIKNCYLILTDSGGLQEEAPSLGKPVIVLRDNTERVEALKSGTAKLVGTQPDNIYKEVEKLIIDNKAYEKMSQAINPFGDGKSSKRILEICLEELNISK